MTRDDDFTGLLERYLDEYEGSTPLPAHVRDAVRARIPSTMQRPAWWPERRFPPMNNNLMRVALASAAVVAAALIGYSTLLGGGNVGGPGINEATPQPSAPAPSVAEIPRGEVAMAPGRYAVRDEFPVRLTFDVPPAWTSCISNPGFEQAICSSDPPGRGVAFLIIDNVLTDPCDATSIPDPPIGESVDDLVAAISDLDGFEVSAAEDVAISGFAGKSIEVSAPAAPECDLITWSTPAGLNGVGPGEVNLMRILDVRGVRVVVTGAYQPEPTTDEHLAELRAILASIEIEAP